LALALDVPVVPVAVVGAEEIYLWSAAPKG